LQVRAPQNKKKECDKIREKDKKEKDGTMLRDN
jgi:hypothetical protein